ncbi:hypothetical protein OH76DRAFT_894845 [Lentinus brumalis]|uniref:Uncharacterized protein n=1 Tax=Lentinus brumalis TaxID=2498619 RepID=A0A371D159_9APHY|nr:hypothetical protein OH76DRAFT_894845 [Polyporus brumalis]
MSAPRINGRPAQHARAASGGDVTPAGDPAANRPAHGHHAQPRTSATATARIRARRAVRTNGDGSLSRRRIHTPACQKDDCGLESGRTSSRPAHGRAQHRRRAPLHARFTSQQNRGRWKAVGRPQNETEGRGRSLTALPLTRLAFARSFCTMPWQSEAVSRTSENSISAGGRRTGC